jgi:nucleotide-binding universal stress UspA family protein
MFTTALVALDLSPAEAPIVDCLGDLRRWGVTRLVLTHVVRVGYAQGAGYGHEPDLLAWLEKRAVPLRAAGLAVEVHVRAAGVPADEILAAAAETGADLVVVGSRSESRVQALFLGSVARAVIHQSRLPVLLQWVEPTAEATAETCAAVCADMLRHVMLATDFSRHGAAAEAAAAALAANAGRVTCLTVMAPAARHATPLLPVMADAALAVIKGRVAAAGGTVATLVAEGEPAPTIARIAAEEDSSLIIVGKHGQGWIERMLIGNTAAAICETARRPVLMVPLAAVDG